MIHRSFRNTGTVLLPQDVSQLFCYLLDVPEDQTPCAFLSCTGCRLSLWLSCATVYAAKNAKLDICKATSGPHEAERYYGKFRIHVALCDVDTAQRSLCIEVHWIRTFQSNG